MGYSTQTLSILDTKSPHHWSVLKASDIFAPRLLLTIKSCVCGVFLQEWRFICRLYNCRRSACALLIAAKAWNVHYTGTSSAKASSYSSSISCRSNSRMCCILSASARGVIVVIKINLNGQFFLLGQLLSRRNEKSVCFIASYLNNNNNQLLALLPLLVDVVTGWFYNWRYI